MAREAGLEVVANDYVVRQTVNRKLQTTLNRIFVQARFRRPADA